MTGPEHYREAERLLSDSTYAGDGIDGEELSRLLAAQAHATLAVAAATMDAADMNATVHGGATTPNSREWDKAIGS